MAMGEALACRVSEVPWAGGGGGRGGAWQRKRMKGNSAAKRGGELLRRWISWADGDTCRLCCVGCTGLDRAKSSVEWVAQFGFGYGGRFGGREGLRQSLRGSCQARGGGAGAFHQCQAHPPWSSLLPRLRSPQQHAPQGASASLWRCRGAVPADPDRPLVPRRRSSRRARWSTSASRGRRRRHGPAPRSAADPHQRALLALIAGYGPRFSVVVSGRPATMAATSAVHWGRPLRSGHTR